MRKLQVILVLCAIGGFLYMMARADPQPTATEAGTTAVPVTLKGGHETDPRDRGRPVVLIAAALGVPLEVFREAFKRVQPAPAGQRPTPEQERRNKAVLLEALRPYGVTNERLDEVSNYYRYVRSRGELWPVQPAVAYALIKNGQVVGFKIEKGGSGYSSLPVASIPNIQGEFQVQLAYGKVFEENGAVTAITMKAKE